MEGWQPRDVFRCDRDSVRAAVAEHPDARLGDRLSRHGAVRRHQRLGRARHDQAVRAAGSAVGGCGALRRRPERARAAGRALSTGGHRADVPQARARPAAAAARSTCSIAQPSGRSKPAWRSLAAFRAADPDRFRWRDPPYEYEHRLLPIDILAGSSELREQIEAGVPGARHRAILGAGHRRLPRAPETVPSLLTIGYNCSTPLEDV